MKKQSRTVPRRRQSVSPTPRHLPLVDILIDTQAELQELVVASGLKVALVRGCGQGLRASNRRARHLPMRYETGLPSSVIRFRT